MIEQDDAHAGFGGPAGDNEGGDEDEAFLGELRAEGPFDPVPDEMMAAARAAFVWRTLDAELAALTYDSSADDRELAGVRGAATARLLTFEAPEMTVEVEATAAGTGRRLIGQLVPPQRGEVEVRHPGGSTTVQADELGRFWADGVAPGPVSLRCRGRAAGITVVTDWVLV
jgi:hypothetical protein